MSINVIIDSDYTPKDFLEKVASHIILAAWQSTENKARTSRGQQNLSIKRQQSIHNLRRHIDIGFKSKAN